MITQHTFKFGKRGWAGTPFVEKTTTWDVPDPKNTTAEEAISFYGDLATLVANANASYNITRGHAMSEAFAERPVKDDKGNVTGKDGSKLTLAQLTDIARNTKPAKFDRKRSEGGSQKERAKVLDSAREKARTASPEELAVLAKFGLVTPSAAPAKAAKK